MKQLIRSTTSAVAAFALALALAGTSWGATVSGTLAKPGVTKTGRIYLQLTDNWGNVTFGTSVASSATSFTIQGVRSGSYQLFAFMDVQGYGVRHTMDPAWPTDIDATSGIPVTINTDGDTVSVGTVTLTNPANVSPVAVTPGVIVGTGGNLVGWDQTSENDYYNITSYTNSSCSAGAVVHSNIPSGGNDLWIHIGGTATSSYKVESVTVRGDGTLAKVTSACATGTAPTGGVTATGKVYFPGISPSGPLFVALMDEPNNKFFISGISSPVSPQTYTVNNIPPGTYKLGMFLDPQNKGIIGNGTIMWGTSSQAEILITVGNSAVTLPDLTFTGRNADIGVTTQHGTNGIGNDWYNLDIRASDGMKHPVSVQITDGPNLSLKPVDLGISRNWPEYGFWQGSGELNPPTVGDTYSFSIGYSDGSSENLTRSVTGVIGTIPTPTFPPPNGTVNPGAGTFPLFAWSMPDMIPGIYTFKPMLENMNGDNSPEFSWTATSMTNGYSLSQPATYTWDAIVIDGFKNVGYYAAQFTTTTGGPTISTLSPATGAAGTSVTITGSGFSTTPANNTVKFNGVTAIVTTSTATTIGVQVPGNAPAGPVSVTVGGIVAVSPVPFNATIGYGGSVLDTAGNPIVGATLSLVEDPTKTATSITGGTYNLATVPSGVPFSLKITASGKAPAYTSMMQFTASTSGSYTMYTAADLTGWGSTGGKGAIRTRATLAGDANVYISGATVTATSTLQPGKVYATAYNGGGSVTDTTGIFTIPNVDEGDAVVITATRPGYTFEPRTYVTHNGAVSENRLKGSPLVPTITGFSPGSGAPGNAVTITGTNFDPTPANNTVRFNGTAAVVQSASATQLIAVVPAGATSGTISVTLTTNGQIAISGSSFTVTAPAQYNLNLVQTGYGGGSVTCNGVACAPSYSPGASVTMGNIPNGADSVFGGWSGACTGTGGCTLVMNQDQFLTATFNLMPVKDDGDSYYLNVSTPYAGAPGDGSSGTLKMQAVTVVDTIVMNKNFNGGIDGGYNGDFTNQTGTTTIQGNCTVTAGSMTGNHLAIKGQVTIGAGGKAIPNGITIK